MRIHSIRIKDFRKLTGPVCIDRIDGAMTVISGDNEEGKSTVLDAIRTVLFTRHRVSGDTADRMQPFGQSVRPEIGLDFAINGNNYALRKAFCRRPEAELTWTGGRATGDAAEDKLQELLRFVPPGKGAAKAEHQGIWGLFWVAQGTSFGALRMSEGSRHTLTSALEGEVGQVLGGERGRALLQVVRSRYDEMFTATGRPREEYRKIVETVEESERKVARLQGALKAYDDRIDDLERVRGRLATYERERAVERARDSLKAAEVAHRRIIELENGLRNAQNAAEIARSKRDAAAERWNSRAKKIDAVARAKDEADDTARREAEARWAVEPLKRLRGRARWGGGEGSRVWRGRSDVRSRRAEFATCPSRT
jgi:DNA repair exonuclease SbcCD ATPase subunit